MIAESKYLPADHSDSSLSRVTAASLSLAVSDPDRSILSSLNASQQVKLSEILDAYLERLGRGESPTQQEIIDAHPELRKPLEVYLAKLNDLQHFLVPQTQDDLSGQKLDDFELIRPIGRGGMGVVYEAWQKSLGRSVAIKILPSAALLESKFVDRFANEARAAAILDHPHIVPVYATGRSNGIPYFAMRLIDGPSLEQEIASRIAANQASSHATAWCSTDIRELLLQFANLADALQAAHEVGIVHRDIKPSNILQSKDGKLWIADFGLARIANTGSVTKTGEMIGTIRYMSPEQAIGPSEAIDYRTDLYSLAATLFESIALRPLIEGDDGPQLLAKIAKVSLPNICQFARECPPDLDTVLERATAKHKEDRYANAAALRDDLRRIAQGLPITTKRISPLVKSLRWANEHRKVVAASIPVVLLAVVWLITSNLMIRAERDRQERYRKAAHQTVEQFGSQLIDDLANLPGAESIRSQVVNRTLQYYQEFAAQSNHDPAMQVSLANAYTRMGNLHEELGIMKEAISEYQSAEQIYADLIDNGLESSNQVSSIELQRRILDNRNHLAMAMNHLSQQGRIDSEIDSTDNEIVLLQDTLRLARDFAEGSDSSELELQYALTLNNLGAVLLQTNIRQALEHLKLASEKLDKLAQDHPNDEAISRGLAATHHNLGRIYAAGQLQDIQESKKHFSAAIDGSLKLANQSGNRLRASPELVKLYIEQGNLQLADEEISEAQQSFINAGKIAESVVQIVPTHDDMRRLLATAQVNQSVVLSRTDKKREAALTLEQAIQNLDALRARNMESESLQNELILARNNYGRILGDLGRYQSALENFQTIEQILLTSHNSPQQSYRTVYENYLRVAREVGKLELIDRLENLLKTLDPSSSSNPTSTVRIAP